MADQKMTQMLDLVFSGVYLVNTQRKITFWNKGAEKVTGYAPGEVTGRFCPENFLMHVNEEGKFLCKDSCPLLATIADGEEREAFVYLRHKDGHRVPVVVHTAPLRDAEGEIEGAVETFTDHSAVVAARKDIAQLTDSVNRDALTGAVARRFAENQIVNALADLHAGAGNTGLLFIDIDYFKKINDRYGHDTGDGMLKVITQTIMSSLRQQDLVARWGGEEFVVLLRQVNPQFIAAIAEKLRRLVEASRYKMPDGYLVATVSIGATYLRKEDTPESVVNRADRLMYASKAAGRNRVTCDAAQATG